MKVCTFKMKVYTLLKLFLYKQIEFGFCYTNLTNPIQVQILVLQAITKLTKQSFVLALLARSAYFALLSRLNARTKQSFVLVLLKQNKHFEKVLTKAKLQLRRKH